MNQVRRGYIFGFLAYAAWGFFPLYWKLLKPAGALEILAHRVVWSAVFVTLLLVAMRNWRFVAVLARRPRTLAGIAGAAVFIAINWGMYIYGVNSSHVVETSLGYFINPLVTVLLGVVVLRERLRPTQWIAIAVGAVAVIVLTVDYGRPPWIALTLAASFALYGLMKKSLALPAAEGLFLESLTLTVPALVYLGWLVSRDRSTFGHVSALQTTMLVLAGAVTAIPLLLFAGAANRIPLTGLGLLQYLTPILQLGCGVLVFHEPMPPAQLAGFALVWLALVVFTWDGIRHARRTRKRAGADTETAAEAVATTATTS
ncbi:EamA family transporter RarD [Planosporangium thailandense]|uniref:EamA family transporter RarD n=1 Tax=Planosporangium thailandense TaxID=765197 RepID=A0ABX0XRM3_9ACTN|nr:EamA family transporter RarD [Planosporangium thailandense]